MSRPEVLPVTLLSGFLGAGKTTLLNHLLTHAGGRRLGVIVNDLSAVNVDAGLVVRHEGSLVELSNGCICCTLRDELVAQVASLARQGGLDALVVESTGVSEPLPVAQGFLLEAEGRPLTAWARPDTLVTVVDASTFLQDFDAQGKVEDRDPTAPPEDRRNLVDLLVDQVEFADVLVLNKVDLVSSRRLAAVRQRLRALNPGALLVEADHGRVDPALVLDTGRFDLAASERLPAWQRELTARHVPETVEYGIGNFALSSPTAFHPERLHRFFARRHPRLLRAKGWFTLASQPGAVWQFQLAGRKKSITFDGWNTGRQVELVLIGLFGEREKRRLRRDLERCLWRPDDVVGSDPFARFLEAVR